MPLAIIYEDDSLVAIYKPAGMFVHRTALAPHEQGDDELYVLQTLRDQLGQRVYPVHRLDRATQGVLLMAKSSECARNLSEQFSNRKVSKKYRALVRGWVGVPNNQGDCCPTESLSWGRVNVGQSHHEFTHANVPRTDLQTIDHSLSTPKSHLTKKQRNKNKAKREHSLEDDEETRKPAVTRYRPLSYWQCDVEVDKYPTSRYSVVELYPQTGRAHQLRRHMKAIGHPIVGDVKYGKGTHNRFFRNELGILDMMLVATELAFSHPVSGESCRLTASADQKIHPFL